MRIPREPVAYWRPVDGVRHGMFAEERPYPGQVRRMLCGTSVTITKPRDEDWLAPTCASCWAAAKRLRDVR